MAADWRIVEEAGPAAVLHAGSVAAMAEDPPRRTARILVATEPALVLGSNQPETDFDAAALGRAGLAVVRRRSGGGAVLVGPGRVVWVDLLVPAGDPLWADDVGRAAWWVGDAWRRALVGTGLAVGATVEVWKGAMQAGRWSSQVCFAGLGPGEVTLGGRKVVGVSQRRNRRVALFQTAALLVWEPADYLDLLSRAGPPVEGAAADLDAAAVGLGPGAGPRVLAALVDVLRLGS